MNRHYYISENLDDLERVERELEASGISTDQIHVLSENDAEVEQHHLHDVPSLMKKDVVNTGMRGVAIGVGLAILVLAVAYSNGWTDSAAGWTPFLFLAVVALGFCAWEGGFLGIQQPNSYFKRFESQLHEGKHVFFVDVEDNQEEVLTRVVGHHPMLQMAGTGEASPHWLVTWQQRWRAFRRMI
ncbi:magnesium transporter [Pseudomonas sp.]|uniref:magnesium transporter n=1 Tax=Pseudomonas sp. TaxID=306 RepID=UPI003D124A30